MSADTVIADPPAAPEADAPAVPRPPTISVWTQAKFVLVRGFLYGWSKCFSLTGLYLFGKVFGTCEWAINYKRRRRFREHMERVFGDHLDRLDPALRRAACRHHFARTRCDKLFYLIFDKLPKEKILRRIKFHHRERFDEALARGKGVYVCMSHDGSHHVLILLMALMGYRVAGVRDRNEGALRRYVQHKYEESFPEFKDIRMFFADTYPRQIYRGFRDGFIVGSALDVGRDRGAHLRTAPVTLFDREREFLTGTMQIALRCGAPILQGFVVSRKNFYFHLIPRGPLVDPATQRDEPAILAEAMQRYADNIADHLSQYPDHISKS